MICDFVEVRTLDDQLTVFQCVRCLFITAPLMRKPLRECGDDRSKALKMPKCIYRNDGFRLTIPCNVQGGNQVLFCEWHGELVSEHPLIDEAVSFIEERGTIKVPTISCRKCPERRRPGDNDYTIPIDEES
jgi:hypothetical protein